MRLVIDDGRVCQLRSVHEGATVGRKEIRMTRLILSVSALVFCLSPGRGDSLKQGSPVTFSKNVAPILYGNCVECHRPGDIAPMSLLTYKDARPWAGAIREAVVSRTMPPWHADPRYGHFSNDARLSKAEIETMDAWAKAGAPEGDPRDMPPLPKFVEGWKIGTPMAIIDIGQDFTVQENGAKDEYVYFTVPSNFTEGKWVKAVELRPGNRRVVHHSHVWIEAPEAATTTPAAGTKPVPNYVEKRDGLAAVRADAPVIDNGCWVEDGGNLPGRKLNDGTGPLGSYLPGKTPDVYPAGTAKFIPAGAKLKFQIHYNKSTSAPETDRSMVGFIFADQPPEHPLRRVDSSAYLFRIPPGDPNHEVSNCTTFQKDALLYSYVAHMHYRGKDMRFELERPSGERETLLFVPHYSFAWQQIYRLRDPVPVHKGDRLIVTAHFDNSLNNKWNPEPGKVVRWGEASGNEMMDGWVEYIDAPAAKSQLAGRQPNATLSETRK